MKRFANLLSVKTWAILLLIVVVLLVLLSWRAACTAAKLAGDQATIGEARTASAVETIEVLAENAAENSAEQAQLETYQDEIREQPDPALRDALARRRLCQLQGRSPC